MRGTEGCGGGEGGGGGDKEVIKLSSPTFWREPFSLNVVGLFSVLLETNRCLLISWYEDKQVHRPSVKGGDDHKSWILLLCGLQVRQGGLLLTLGSSRKWDFRVRGGP